MPMAGAPRPRLHTSADVLLDPENAEITRYVGQNSIPALLREQTSNNEPEDVNVIRQDMRSLLGLDNSAPFPLMSSRHLNRLTSDISTELPSDREVMKYARPAGVMGTYSLSTGFSEPTRRSHNHSGASSSTLTTSSLG